MSCSHFRFQIEFLNKLVFNFIIVLVSDFNQLFDLNTLEIRGSKEAHFKLLFDEPLSWVKHLSVESVTLEAADSMKFRPNVEQIDPSKNFDYVPNSEKLKYNIFFETPVEMAEAEIVPYDVYKMEKTIESKLRTISFYGWDNLKVLRISDCQLDQLYWEMFDGLKNLEHLSLEKNAIKEIPSFSFYGALNIKTLSLSHNQILDLHYKALAGLLHLELLDLSNNNLVKLSELTFPPFPKLKIADVSNNPIRNLYASIFGVLNTTKVLYLGSEDIPMEINAQKPFEHLESLIYLEIANVKADLLDQNSFSSLSSLEILKIRSGSIELVEFDTFAKMIKLKELHLINCRIEEISMDTFFGAKQLTIIDLSNNLIAELPPGLFDDQHDLVEINLDKNMLTTLPSDIFKLKSLKMVRLTDNPWDCNCEMRDWKQAITNKIKSSKLENKCNTNSLIDDKKNCESKSIQTYVFDHKLSPKCKTPSNLENRSVFYALRKVLKCSPKIISVPTKIPKDQKKAIKVKMIKHEKNNEIKKKQNTLKYQLFERKNTEIFDNNAMDNSL